MAAAAERWRRIKIEFALPGGGSGVSVGRGERGRRDDAVGSVGRTLQRG